MKKVLYALLFLVLFLSGCQDEASNTKIKNLIYEEAKTLYEGDLSEEKIFYLQSLCQKEALHIYKSNKITAILRPKNIVEKFKAQIINHSRLQKLEILHLDYESKNEANAVVAYHIQYLNQERIQKVTRKMTLKFEKINNKWYMTRSLGNKIFS